MASPENYLTLDVLVFCCSVLVVLTGLDVIPRVINTPLAILGSFYVLAAATVWFNYFQGHPLSLRPFLYLIPGILAYLYSPFRTLIFAVILCIMVPALKTRRFRSLGAFLVGTLALLLVATIVNDYRRSSMDTGIFNRPAASFGEEIWGSKQQHIQPSWVRLVNRFHGFDSVALTVNLVPSFFPYSHLNILTDLAWRVIPRSIVDKKSETHRGRNFSTTIWAMGERGLTKREEANISPSMCADLYQINGLLLVAVGAAFYGVLVGFLESWQQSLGPLGSSIILALFGTPAALGIEQEFDFRGRHAHPGYYRPDHLSLLPPGYGAGKASEKAGQPGAIRTGLTGAHVIKPFWGNTGTRVSIRIAAGPLFPSDPGAATLRTLVIHDWLYTYAGSERVLEAILQCLPAERIFALVDFLEGPGRFFLQGLPVTTSFLQRLPLSRTHRRLYLPLMPLAVESLDVSVADLVVSSSAAIAKGVRTRRGQLHLCYCHSPARYAWDLTSDYLQSRGFAGVIKNALARLVFQYFRRWDAASARRVDHFITNSHYNARRLQQFYGRDGTVIYPPVDVARFPPAGKQGGLFDHRLPPGALQEGGPHRRRLCPGRQEAGGGGGRAGVTQSDGAPGGQHCGFGIPAGSRGSGPGAPGARLYLRRPGRIRHCRGGGPGRRHPGDCLRGGRFPGNRAGRFSRGSAPAGHHRGLFPGTDAAFHPRGP